MKNVTILFLAFSLLLSASCKKKSGSPSVVGGWKISNVEGTVSTNLSLATGETTTYSFSSDSGILTESTVYPAISSAPIITTYHLITELWTFNSNGTYAISEVYANGYGSISDSSAVSGSWEYLSSTQANNGLLLAGGASYILGNITSTDVYTLQFVGSSLKLTVNNSQNNSGTVTSANVSYTFTRQ